MIQSILLLAMFVLPSEMMEPPLTDSMLWKIEGKNAKPSYLFGTVHLLPQREFELKSKVLTALKSTEQLVLELDMGNPLLQSQAMSLSLMAGDTTMDVLLDAREYHVLDSVLKNTIGLGLDNVKAMKPFVISAFLQEMYIDGESATFEIELMNLALADSIDVIGLETVADQMAVFDSIPYQIQADELIEFLAEGIEMKAMYAEMISDYKDEKLSKLTTSLRQELGDDLLVDYLIDERNRKWIPEIEKLIATRPSFIAVGAGHLGGDNGLIALLQQAGYTVSAVK